MQKQQSTPPWQHSPQLGEYVWNPQTDQITTRNGQTFPRPASIPRTALSKAAWTGPVPLTFKPELSTSPTQPSQYLLGRPGNLPPGPQDSGKGKGAIRGGIAQATQNMGNLSVANDPSVLNPPPEAQLTFATQSADNNRGWVRLGLENVTSTLFPDFKIRPGSFYQRGRIFLVLWSEPAGNSKAGAGSKNTGKVTAVEPGITFNQYGEKVFSKVRRFVVIREGKGYCSTLPVSTYGGRGVAKVGVVKSEHCIIYTGKTPPTAHPSERPRRGEDGMRSATIRMDPDHPANTLDPMSRLNLASVMTVQSNIKAKPYGKINEQSMQILLALFQNVFQGRPIPGPSRSLTQQVEEDENDQEEGEEDDDDDEDDDSGEEDSEEE